MSQAGQISIGGGGGGGGIALSQITVVVTSAQLKTCVIPVQILPAPGANTSYQLISGACYMPFNSIPYVNVPSNLFIINGLNQFNFDYIQEAQFNPRDNTNLGLLGSSADTFLTNIQIYTTLGEISTQTTNQPYYLYNADTNMIDGDSDLHIQFLYRLITTPF